MTAHGPRIIAGAWGGRRLQAPPGLATRPLLDRIKQSLFDRLGQRLDGQTVVDCCAGSGAFGIEAASRGAAAVHLIEPAGPALTCLRANLATLGQPPALRLHAGTFQQVLPRLSGLDLAFGDPPFPWWSDDPPAIAALIRLACAALAPGGLLVLRGEQGCHLPPLPAGAAVRDETAYGRSVVWWILVSPDR